MLQQTPRRASDAERVAALRQAARALRNAALDHQGPGAAPARRLSEQPDSAGAADAAARDRAESALALPLKLSLASLQNALAARSHHPGQSAPELRRDWMAPDGRALLDIAPRKPPVPDRATTRSCADFAQRRADGGARCDRRADFDARIRPSSSFAHSSKRLSLALIAITVLLWVALRRFDDVLLTMVPLLVSGLVTLELCVVLGISLNFANIIALPLLLGIGVAFKIYYVMAWRNGQAELLKSGLTQAIILSAATTGTAFGSLWLSTHPGTASMGKLLVLSLVCTLIGAVFFQPILMGKPRASARSI